MSKYSNYTKEQLIQKIKQLESKKYGLVWDDEKEPEKVVLKCQNNIPILEKIDEKTIKTDIKKPTNILIEGDNYHALQVLNYTHKGQIDVIYIDPPYNTGHKDFTYNDSFVDKEDGYRHSKWLNFMSKRLKLAHSLLNEDGVIFISIGENEFAQLKILCDDIFGEKNYITNFIWEKTQHFGRQKVNFYSNVDYILCYSKQLVYLDNKKELLVEKIKDEHEDAPLYNASNSLIEIIIPPKKAIFNIPDGEYFKTTDEKYNLLEKVVVKNGKNNNQIKLQLKSRWSQNKIDEEIIKGTTFWVKSDKFAIRAIYGNGKTSNESPKQIIFTNSNYKHCAISRFNNKVGTNEEGSGDLFDLLGEQDIFKYPKPKTLIKYLLSLYFDSFQKKYKENITILDFFAGSGTTGHAVLELNKEDGGNRQFILCTNNENSICEEVTYPRISKVINGYTTPKGVNIEGLGGNLDYYKTDLIPTNGISNITDTIREELTKKAGNMIAIKENTHYMVKLCEHYQIFQNESSKKQTAIYFTEDLSCFDELIEQTKSHSTKLYIFSFGKIDKSSYKYLGKNYQIEDIPEPIIEIYKEINKEVNL